MAVKRKISDDDISSDDEHQQPKQKTRGRKAGTPRKLYTKEDAFLIRKLKEEDGLSWSEVAKHFPGRSAHTLQVTYYGRLKGLCDSFTSVEMEEMKALIKKSISDHRKKFWADIGAQMGKSGAGCERAAKEAKLTIAMY